MGGQFDDPLQIPGAHIILFLLAYMMRKSIKASPPEMHNATEDFFSNSLAVRPIRNVTLLSLDNEHRRVDRPDYILDLLPRPRSRTVRPRCLGGDERSKAGLAVCQCLVHIVEYPLSPRALQEFDDCGPAHDRVWSICRRYGT